MSKKKRRPDAESLDQRMASEAQSKKIFDIEWLKKNDQGDQIYKTNQMKEQLAHQWGSDLVLDDVREMRKEVKPVCMLDELAEQKVYVLKFAREKMMEGLMGKELIASIKQKFTRETIKNTYKDLKKVLAYEGVLGCVAIDAQDYKTASEASALIKKCPHRNTIKYVLMSQDDKKFSLASRRRNVTGSTGDVNGVLASENSESVMQIPVCAVTGMPIIASDGGHGGFNGAGSMTTGTDAVAPETTAENKQGEVEVLGSELAKTAKKFKEAYHNRKQKPIVAEHDYDKADFKLACGCGGEVEYNKETTAHPFDLNNLQMNVNCDIETNPVQVRYNDEVEIEQPANVFNESAKGVDIVLNNQAKPEEGCSFGSSGLIV